MNPRQKQLTRVSDASAHTPEKESLPKRNGVRTRSLAQKQVETRAANARFALALPRLGDAISDFLAAKAAGQQKVLVRTFGLHALRYRNALLLVIRVIPDHEIVYDVVPFCHHDHVRRILLDKEDGGFYASRRRK